MSRIESPGNFEGFRFFPKTNIAIEHQPFWWWFTRKVWWFAHGYVTQRLHVWNIYTYIFKPWTSTIHVGIDSIYQSHGMVWVSFNRSVTVGRQAQKTEDLCQLQSSIERAGAG